MDLIAIMAGVAAGIIALIFATKHAAAGFLTHVFAWTAGPYLAGVFVWLGLRSHEIDITPLRWNTGLAEVGPLTLLILVLAVASPFILGWDDNGRNAKR